MTQRKILGSARGRFRVINIVRINTVKIRFISIELVNFEGKISGKNDISSRFAEGETRLTKAGLKGEDSANTRGASIRNAKTMRGT